MKLRLIAVFVILFVAAWLPIIAQQSAAPPTAPQAQAQTPPAPDTGKSADKPACACCDHHDHAQAKSDSPGTCCHGKHGKAHSMHCCDGKDAKDMSCCNKDSNGKQAAAGCCKGKDGTMCARHNGKDCCDDPACKSCCAKNSTAANTSDVNTNTCCGAAEHCCHPSKA